MAIQVNQKAATIVRSTIINVFSESSVLSSQISILLFFFGFGEGINPCLIRSSLIYSCRFKTAPHWSQCSPDPFIQALQFGH